MKINHDDFSIPVPFGFGKQEKVVYVQRNRCRYIDNAIIF